MSAFTHHRARAAALSRSRGPNDPDLISARAETRCAQLEERIRAAVDAWPPLTPEQRDRLAVILRPVVGDHIA